MTENYYEVLGLEPNSGNEEVEVAFQELLVIRRARRAKTSDLHAAYAVLSDQNLRRSYNLALLGMAASEKLVRAKDATVEIVDQVREAVPDVDLQAVARDAWQATLKAVVLMSGVTAKVADVTAVVSRRVQCEAGRRITQES